jgi:hypothetical protein
MTRPLEDIKRTCERNQEYDELHPSRLLDGIPAG